MFSCKTKYVYFPRHSTTTKIDTIHKYNAQLKPIVQETTTKKKKVPQVKNKAKGGGKTKIQKATDVVLLPDTTMNNFSIQDSIPTETNLLQKDTTLNVDTTRFVDKDNTSIKDNTIKDSLSKDSSFLNPNILQDTTKAKDSISYKVSKDAVPDIIDHIAQDSMVWDLPRNMVYLYKKTNTKFQDIVLDADKMAYNTTTNIASAIGKVDTTGKVSERVKFTQKDQKYQSDSLEYNFKSQKGIIDNTITQQSEMFVHSKITKRIDTSAFFGKGGAFTTCSYDEPHFDFFTQKYKLIKDKVVVTGPIFPEFEGVLIPIPIPFGMFPLNNKRKGGIIIPSYTVDNQRGFGLLGGGYMLNLNQYVKATITGDFYTYLSWAVRMNSSYLVRYKFNGTLNFNYQDNRLGFPGDPGFSKTKTYSIQWTHTQDRNVDPNMTFSASVNFSSSQYNSTQFYNPALGFNNQQSSSIALGYTFKYSPVSMQLSINHNQNNLTRLYNFTLPNLNINITPINPFQRQDRVGALKWYEKLSIGYAGNFTNSFAAYDTAFRFKKILDTMVWGMSHSIPIQLQLPSLGPISATPNISYSENWFDRKVTKYWDENTKSVQERVNRGIYAMRQISMGLALNTALYGTWLYKRGRVAGLRHVIRPNVSITYSPSLVKKQYYTYQTDSAGNRSQTTSYFAYPGALDSFSNVTFGGISFGIDNNLEMKVRIKRDTGYELKKIVLLDRLSITSSYNFIADSMNLAPFNMAASTNLFNKVNISANAVLNPYQVNPEKGSPIRKYAWQGDKFSIGNISSASLSISTNFSISKKTKEGEKNKVAFKPGQDYTYDEWQALKYDVLKNPAKYADYSASTANIGISFSLNYSSSWSIFERKYIGKTTWNTGLNLSGSFPLTPLMVISANANIAFQNMIKPQLTNLSFSMSRQIHCWTISFNVSPIGYYKSFYFKISPRATILQDLKLDKNITYY